MSAETAPGSAAPPPFQSSAGRFRWLELIRQMRIALLDISQRAPHRRLTELMVLAVSSAALVRASNPPNALAVDSEQQTAAGDGLMVG